MTPRFRHPSRASHRQQRGVVLLFTLVVLVILLAGGVAVVRSTNASLGSAGNLAFKRDLVNQGERAVARAMNTFEGTGTLAQASARQDNNQNANYSAVALATNAQGVPLALLNNTTFATLGVATNDIQDTSAQVTVRYLIDRLCNSTGASGTLGASGCVYAPANTDVRGGSSQEMGTRIPPPPSVVYRLSMRVTGPRDTQVFLQASFARPDQ